MANKYLAIVVVIVLVGGGAFFGGMKYAESKIPARGAGGNFANLSPQERQARFALMGAGRGGRSAGNGSSFVMGEIIAKDNQSITVKMRDGGSKIIFFSTSTEVMKTVTGSAKDLALSDQVVTSGT